MARALYEPPAAKRRAEAYREHLRLRFGPGVPPEIVEAWERAYDLAWERPDQAEALLTGIRAGAGDRQRLRAGVQR